MKNSTNRKYHTIATISLLLAILAILVGHGEAGIANPVRAQEAARLFLCKFAGYDGGVNKAYKNILLSRDDPTYTRQCLMGCAISWFFGINSLIEFETSHNPLAKLGGSAYRRVLFYAQQCVRVNVLGQQKCSLYYTLPICVFNSYRNFMIQKFIPWWPPIKGALNSIFDAIPFLKKWRNKMRTNAQKMITAVVDGPLLRPLIKWFLQQMRTGFMNNLLKNAISAILVALSRIAIPPPLPNPVPAMVAILKFLFKLF